MISGLRNDYVGWQTPHNGSERLSIQKRIILLITVGVTASKSVGKQLEEAEIIDGDKRIHMNFKGKHLTEAILRFAEPSKNSSDF